MPLAKGTTEVPLTNAMLGELLCRAADEPERGYHQRRALKRAGRAAFRWPVEASTLVATGHSLTELRGVGPWLERVIGQWLAAPPPVHAPPPIRRDFLSQVDVERLLADTTQAVPIRGDLQTHTRGSDGTASVRDMALAAAARGLEYVGITDHSKGLRIANGMTEEQLGPQGEEIDRLNEEFASSGFRVLRAVEMNLSPRGEGDLDPEFLKSLDLVLGAFHSRLRVTEDQTERYLAAFRNPHLHVLAHPRGRIFNFRLGLKADWPRVFAAPASTIERSRSTATRIGRTSTSSCSGSPATSGPSSRSAPTLTPRTSSRFSTSASPRHARLASLPDRS